MYLLVALMGKLLEQYFLIRHILVAIEMVRQYGMAQSSLEVAMDGK